MTKIPPITRIQRRRTKGFKLPEGTVCCTRPGLLGNPFETAEQYQRRWYFRDIPNWSTQREHLYEIARDPSIKHLACWCPLDKACHVDVLVAYVNQIRRIER